MGGHRFDADPEALEWARGKVAEVTGRWRANAARADRDDLGVLAEKWRRMAVTVENALIGGKTGDLGAFDARHADVAAADRSGPGPAGGGGG